MKMFWLGLLAALMMSSAPAKAQNISYKRHIIVVLDNSGTVIDRYAEGTDFERFYAARRLFIEQLGERFDRSDLISVMSVYRPRVIWQGSAGFIDRPQRSRVLYDFLAAGHGGCADYEAVLKAVRRQQEIEHRPLVEVIFFASLVHTGPQPCEVVSDNFNPPESFFAGLSELMESTGVSVSLYWTFEEVYDHAVDYFLQQNLRPIIRGVEETIAGLE